MVRIRGTIGDWPVDLQIDLDDHDLARLARVLPERPAEAVSPVPAATSPEDPRWQAALTLLREAGRMEGPQLLEQLAGLAGGTQAGKRLLVRLRHDGRVRLEAGADAPVYCWCGD